MEVPIINRMEYQLCNIDDEGFMSLMDAQGNSKDDVRLPEDELGTQIRTMFDDGKDVLVAIQSAMGQEAAVGVKESPK